MACKRNCQLCSVYTFIYLMLASLPTYGKDLHTDAEAALAPPSLDSIRRQIETSFGAIDIVDVSYRVTNPNNEKVARHRVVQKASMRFAENSHFSTLQPDADLDVNRTRQYFTGNTFDVFYVNSRYFETSRKLLDPNAPWKLRIDLYLTAIGWWPKNDDVPPNNIFLAPFRPLVQVLKDKECRIRGLVKLADGTTCVDVQCGRRERLWLDAKRGFTIRQRDVQNPNDGSIIFRVRCEHFDKYVIRDGTLVWFPSQLRIDSYESAAIANTSLLNLESMKINATDSSIFQFRAPAGTLIEFLDDGQWLLIPGGRDLLDQSANTARKLRIMMTNNASIGVRIKHFATSFLISGLFYIYGALVGWGQVSEIAASIKSKSRMFRRWIVRA